MLGWARLPHLEVDYWYFTFPRDSHIILWHFNIFFKDSNFCDIQNYVGQNILEVLTNQGSRQNCAIFSVDNDDHGDMTTKCFIALYFDYHKISRTDHIVTVSYQKLYYFIS